MEIRRFFTDSSALQNDTITLTGDEFLHMTKVLRYKVGFKAIVCLNDGYERHCTITQIGKDFALLNVDESKKVDRKNVSLTLYAGLLKNNKLDFVIQKAVELGVDSVVPFVSANSAETKFSLERGEKIALEAAKQCGSAYLSSVKGLVDFDMVLNDIKGFDTVLFAYEGETQNSVKTSNLTGRNIALIVGCEGGFTPEEAEKAKLEGANVVTLGRRILRAETASIVLATLTLDKLGELDYD
ncbi:MAG: 16S rRNA (uracil(1498)-N(3))-methyltransferase [Clostridia bacterium]|nr:16S rRNA (uracil(1498)-N(3))-methyltransferase [Clostridia bacterium]